MYQPNKLKFIIVIAAVLIFGGRSLFSQEPQSSGPAQNYEAALYVVVGSDEGASRSQLPKSLAGMSRQIGENFSYRNYDIANTFIARLGNNGSIDYKSVSNILGGEVATDSPAFLEWNLSGFKALNESGSSGTYLIPAFRFGARIPIKVQATGPVDRPQSIVSYESIGLKLNQFGLAETAPTLIGTISLPRASGTVFLVLAIRKV